MEAVGAPADSKTEMAAAHFPPPVPVAGAPSEEEERDIDNTPFELAMMEPHSNVCDDRPKTNGSLDGVIPTDVTKEASTENPGSGQGSQAVWTIYSGDTEPLLAPMISTASSWISTKRILASTLTQGGTSKPLVLPLGPSKSKPLPLDRASTTPFPHQGGALDEVPPPLGVDTW